MKINYIKNLEDTLIACNRKAYLYKDGKAWDNKKKKTWRKHVPRGKIYMRLSNLEGRAQYEHLVNLTNHLKDIVENKQEN